VAVSTWPYDFDSVFGYRNFSLTDVNGNRLAVANSQWILVNTETGHPIRITEEVTSHYPMDEKAEMTYASRKVPFKDAKEEKEKLIVPRAFIDTNQHVNNAQYIRMALEYVPKDFVIAQVRVEFKNAAVLGDSIKPYVYNDGQLIRILLADEQKKPYAVVEFQKKMNGENND
jgi:acyl-ACP thioesterase